MSDDTCGSYRGFLIYKYTDGDAQQWYGDEYTKLYHGALYLHMEFNSSEPIDCYTGLHCTLKSLRKEIDALYEKYPKLAEARALAEKVYRLSKRDALIDKYRSEMIPKTLLDAVYEASSGEDRHAPFADYPATA